MPALFRPFLPICTSTILALASLVVWSAQPAQAATPPLPVALGRAASYSVLAGSAVTNTLSTNLKGDLGVSPGTAVTGFPPGETQGQTHIGDTRAALARQDARAAYTDAEMRIFTAKVDGDIAGHTYASGVYQAAAALDVSADGIVTLDGEHDPNAVFIFQVGSALNLGARTNIRLINGAQACHVFWQVGSAATIGEGSTFNGTILAHAAITVGATTRVDGRALAGTAITLADNDFISEDCSSAPDGGGTSGGGSVGSGGGGTGGGSGGSGGSGGGGTGGGSGGSGAGGGGGTGGGSGGSADGGGGGHTGGGSGGSGGSAGGGGDTGGNSGGAAGTGGQTAGQLPNTGASPYDRQLLTLGLLLNLAGGAMVVLARPQIGGARKRRRGAHALRV